MLVPRFNSQRYLIPDSLTQSSGTITCVVGSKTYTVTPSGLTAITIYYLYLVISGGNTVLTAVTIAPSSYRASNPTAILVGAFLSDGNIGGIGFGSFMNIEGVPKSGPVIHVPTFTAFGTVTAITAYVAVSGSRIFSQGRASAGTVTGAEARISIPGTIVTATGNPIIGGEIETSLLSATLFKTHILVIQGNNFLNVGFKTSSSNGFIARLGTDVQTNSGVMTWTAEVETSDWLSTPLKDR